MEGILGALKFPGPLWVVAVAASARILKVARMAISIEETLVVVVVVTRFIEAPMEDSLGLSTLCQRKNLELPTHGILRKHK
jgi:hypothetical protein